MKYEVGGHKVWLIGKLIMEGHCSSKRRDEVKCFFRRPCRDVQKLTIIMNHLFFFFWSASWSLVGDDEAHVISLQQQWIIREKKTNCVILPCEIGPGKNGTQFRSWFFIRCWYGDHNHWFLSRKHRTPFIIELLINSIPFYSVWFFSPFHFHFIPFSYTEHPPSTQAIRRIKFYIFLFHKTKRTTITWCEINMTRYVVNVVPCYLNTKHFTC